MSISTPLFEGKHIRLGALDHETDAPIESAWTHDPYFMRLMYTEPMRPLSPTQLRKKYETLEKDSNSDKDLFHFRIRTLQAERLIGFGELFHISGTHSCGQICLGIGAEQDQQQGYGSEALSLLLHYAFSELNLHRLTAVIAEYNPAALAFFSKAGFREEVCRRQALARDSRYWDIHHLGILSSDWKS